MTQPKAIVFLCVANAARSQMAEGLARHLLPPDIQVASAGSEPRSLDPRAVTVMEEIGIDISAHYSKSIDALDLDEFDHAVTLCAEQQCPVLPGRLTRLHWPLPDPAAADGADALEAFRTTRDEIRERIRTSFPTP